MNIAFVERVISGVIYSRAELTDLSHLDFAKTLEGTDETVKDFLHMDFCQTIPGMDKQGWGDISMITQQNPHMKKALEAAFSWVRVKRIISE